MVFLARSEGRHTKTLCGLVYVRNPGDYIGKHRADVAEEADRFLSLNRKEG